MANLRTSRFEFIPLPTLKASQIDTPYAKSENDLEKLQDRTYPRVDEIFQDENGNLYLHKEIDGVYRYIKINGNIHTGSQNGNLDNDLRTPFECLGSFSCNGHTIVFEDGIIATVVESVSDNAIKFLKHNDAERSFDEAYSVDIQYNAAIPDLVNKLKNAIGGLTLNITYDGQEVSSRRIITAINDTTNDKIILEAFDIVYKRSSSSYVIVFGNKITIAGVSLLPNKKSFISKSYDYKRIYLNTTNGVQVFDAESLTEVNIGITNPSVAYSSQNDNTVIIESKLISSVDYYQITSNGQYLKAGNIDSPDLADKCLVLNSQWVSNSNGSVFYPFIIVHGNRYSFFNSISTSGLPPVVTLDFDLNSNEEVLQIIDSSRTLNHSNETFGHDKRILAFNIITRKTVCEPNNGGYVYHSYLYYIINGRYALVGDQFSSNLPPRMQIIKVGHYILDAHETFSDGLGYDDGRTPILSRDITYLDNGNLLVDYSSDDNRFYLFSHSQNKYLSSSFADNLFAAYMEIINGHAEYINADSLEASNTRIYKGVTLDNYSASTHGSTDYTISKVAQSSENVQRLELDDSFFSNGNILTKNYGTVSYDSEFLIKGAVTTDAGYKVLSLKVYSVTDEITKDLVSTPLEFGDHIFDTFHILKGYLVFTTISTSDIGYVFMAKSVKPLADYIHNSDTIEMESTETHTRIPSDSSNQIRYASVDGLLHNIYTDNSIVQVFKTNNDDDLFLNEISLETITEANYENHKDNTLFDSTKIYDKTYELKQYILTLSIQGYETGKFALGMYLSGYKYISSYNAYHGDYLFLVGCKDDHPAAINVIRPSAWKNSSRIVPVSSVASVNNLPDNFLLDDSVQDHSDNILDAFPISDHSLVFVRSSRIHTTKVVTFSNLFGSDVLLADENIKEFKKPMGPAYDTVCTYTSTSDGLLAIGDIGEEIVVNIGNSLQHRCGAIPKSYFSSSLNNLCGVVLGDYLILYTPTNVNTFRIKLSYNGIQVSRAVFSQVISDEVNALRLNAEDITTTSITSREVNTNRINLGGASLIAEKGVSPSSVFESTDKAVFVNNFRNYIRPYLRGTRIMPLDSATIESMSFDNSTAEIGEWHPLLYTNGIHNTYYAAYRVRTENKTSLDDPNIAIVLDLAFADEFLFEELEDKIEKNEALYVSIKIGNTTRAINKSDLETYNYLESDVALSYGRRHASQDLYFRASGLPYMNDANLGLNYTKLNAWTQFSGDQCDTIVIYSPNSTNSSAPCFSFGADVILANRNDVNEGDYHILINGLRISQDENTESTQFLKTINTGTAQNYIDIWVNIANNTVYCGTTGPVEDVIEQFYTLANSNSNTMSQLPDSSRYGDVEFNEGDIRKLSIPGYNLKLIPALLKNANATTAYSSGIFLVDCNDNATDISIDKLAFTPLRFLTDNRITSFTTEELLKGCADILKGDIYEDIGVPVADRVACNQGRYGNNKYYTQDIPVECLPKIVALDVINSSGYYKVAIAATSYGDAAHSDNNIGINSDTYGLFLSDNSGRKRYTFFRSGIVSLEHTSFSNDEAFKFCYYNTYVTGFTISGTTLTPAVSSEVISPCYPAGYIKNRYNLTLFDYRIPDGKCIDAKFAYNANYILLKPHFPTIGTSNYGYIGAAHYSIELNFNKRYLAPTYLSKVIFDFVGSSLSVKTGNVKTLACDNRGILGSDAVLGKELDYYNAYRATMSTTSFATVKDYFFSYSDTIAGVNNPTVDNRYICFNYDTVRNGRNYSLDTNISKSLTEDIGNKVYYPNPSVIGVCPLEGTSVMTDPILLVTYVPMTRAGAGSYYIPYGIIAFMDATNPSNKKLLSVGGITDEELTNLSSFTSKLNLLTNSDAKDITYEEHRHMFAGLRYYLLDSRINGESFGNIKNAVRSVDLSNFDSSSNPRKLGYVPVNSDDKYKGEGFIFRGLPPVVKFADTDYTSKLIDTEVDEDYDTPYKYIKVYPLLTGTYNNGVDYSLRVSLVIDAHLGYSMVNDSVEYTEQVYHETTSTHSDLDWNCVSNQLYNCIRYLNSNMVVASKDMVYTFNLNNSELNKNAVDIPDTGAVDNNNIIVYTANGESPYSTGALIVKEEIEDDITNNDILIEGTYVIKTSAPIQVVHLD